ncbi:MAG: mandelate racemase/muconate lactonizing enzyme family protein [Proteobacteria bacterium]|nr:mandelate racemase/muconate lactonizing enzyme family protein [Pseudomonadota bacterium]
MVKIVEVIEKTVPLRSELRNAYIDFSQMTASVVAIKTDVMRGGKPVTGFGFNSNGRYGAGGLMRERFIPRIEAADAGDLVNEAGDNLDPHKVWDVLMTNEKPGGHGERCVAVGVIDMAVWDAVAKIAGVPLYRYLADNYGNGEADDRVFVYAAGGYYYPGKDIEALKAEMAGYLERGYHVVKLKIGGAPLDQDIARIEAVLGIVGAGENLAVDANGSFDLETAIAYAEALRPYELRWYEEAGDPLDYALQAELAKHYDLPMATGENLFSLADARNLLRYGGMRPECDILQFDCALAYGLVEYLRILEMAADHGFSARACVPHGGHQMSLNIAAGLGLGGNESYPDVFKPFGGFADGIAVEDGTVTLPEVPGIGFETKNDLYRLMRDLAGL